MSKYNLAIPLLLDSYRSEKLKPRELILELRQQALAQSDYNAWIYLLSEAELESYLQRLEEPGSKDLPLYGVPFAIKDNIDLADVPTTAACPDFAYTAAESAYTVKALIDAGAVPLGKTNMDQFATGLVGTRSPYGQGKNAFNPDYCSGGSSSGSAISTALGQVSFALGTDTAGSGRVPAAFNNLIGLKPTKGLLSSSGLVPACRTLDSISVFALTCEDAATLLDVVASYDASDAFSRRNSYRNKARYFSGSAPQTFRFGVPSELDFQDDDDCAALFKQALSTLENLGGEAISIDFTPFTKAAKLLYEGPWVAERWLATQGVALDSMLPVIQDIIGPGDQASAPDAFAAQYKLAEYKRSCDSTVESLDFILTPTTPCVFTRADIDEAPIARNSVLGTYTNFMNLCDYSATAVPVGAHPSGVHWGVTLFSSALKDIELLNVAAAMQQAFNLTLGATRQALPAVSRLPAPLPAESIDVVVCGAHLQGQPLNWQLVERGATLQALTTSSANYKLYALSDGKRPGMARVDKDGTEIEVEVWSLPSENFGSFVAGIPAPLGIGKVELADGRWLSGFICDGYGLEDAKDISDCGSWRRWLEQK